MDEIEVEKMFQISAFMETSIFNLSNEIKVAGELNEALCSKINSTMVYIGLNSGKFRKLFDSSNKGIFQF